MANKKKILDVVSISGSRVKEFEGERGYLSTGDLDFNKIANLEMVTYGNKPSRANQNVNIDEVIFAKMKDTKKTLVIDDSNKDIIVSTGFYVLKPSKEILPKYLYHYLNSDYFLNQKNKLSKGATQCALNNEGLANIYIYIQNLETQKKIVEVLDKAQELIDKRKEQIEALDELVKSRFVEMFGSQKDNKFGFKTLPEIIEDDKYALKRGPFGGSLKKSDFIKEGYLVYEQRHAIHNDFNYAKYYISKEKYDDMIMFKVKPKDLLVSCSGVTLGKIAEVPEGAKPGIINQALLKITLNQSVMNNTYFIHLFRSKEIQDKLFGFSRGSGIPNFPSMNDVKLIKFLCPPIELQNQFADFVTKVDKLKFEMEKSLKELEDNFNSLMQKAFKGELF